MVSIQVRDPATRRNTVSDKETVAMLVIGRLQELERSINSKTQGRIRDLQVESTGDKVLAFGITSTYYAKQLATQIIQEELGDFTIENKIEVV